MTSLAESSYSHDNEIAAQIRAEASSIAVKVILKKYGFEEVGVCDVSDIVIRSILIILFT